MRQFPAMRFQGVGETWESFEKKIELLGAIAEVFLEGAGAMSPSVQAYIDGDGSVHIMATHEQVQKLISTHVIFVRMVLTVELFLCEGREGCGVM